MGAGSASFSLVWLAVVAAAYDPYSNQPRFESQNGHLLIVAASGANITLKTSRGGQVNINDQNIFKVLEMAQLATQKVQKWEIDGTNGDGESTRTSIDTFLTPLTKRLEVLEMLMANGSAVQYPRRSPVNLWRNVVRLTTKVNRLVKDVKILRHQADTDECASDPCLHGGTCQDLFNNFHCLCSDQWEGKLCQKDVDECERFRNTGLGCQNGATCQNLPGSYNCICQPGWYGLHCTVKSNSCNSAGSTALCGNGICIDSSNNQNGYICQCNQGWTSMAGAGPCTVDVDECAAKTYPCSHDPLVKCDNLLGSYKCGSCPAGYEGNGYQCRDIDECVTNNGGCSTNPAVQCINTRGSRVCGACPPGYSGDGVTCARADDLCQVNHGGCHSLAQCIQNPDCDSKSDSCGIEIAVKIQNNVPVKITQEYFRTVEDERAGGLTYVQCKCPFGWVGSGVGENGCIKDSSNASLSNCPPSYCLNGGLCSTLSDGSHRCICSAHYTGSRCEIGSGVCLSQPCKNNGTCVAIPGNTWSQSYKCLCSFGFTGDDCQYSILGCGGMISSVNGSLSWPPINASDLNAPPVPLDCRWTISTPNSLEVLNITVQYNISCSLSFLRIHDGFNSEYPATKLCGYSKTSNFTSTRTVVQIVYEFTFRSRPVTTGRQFRQFTLNWTSVPRQCGGDLQVTQHGTLSSPGSPGYYPHYLNCIWRLTARTGKRIQFTFFSMDVESHKSCRFDYLKIYDGPDITSPQLAILCNKTIPPPITTSSYSAALQFKTDDLVSGKGWQLAYTVVEGVPGCGGLINSPFGRITSPQSHKSDDSYGNNLLCEWRILLSGRDRIKLEFTNFKMEYSQGCVYDRLEVFDGPNSESRLIGRWCGNTIPENVISAANSLTIVFSTDASYNVGSFSVDYSTVCNIELSEPNGTISSPLYPSHYPNDRVCHFLISVPQGNAVVLQMVDLDLEHPVNAITSQGEEKETCLYDTLTVYDGDSVNSRKLAEMCGNGTVKTIISSYNYLLIVFKSDVSGEGRGFMANYSSTPINCGGIYRAESGTIRSPVEIPPRITCRWVISAPAGKVIELGWSAFSLQHSLVCMRDSIKIYENSTDVASANQIGETYCGDHIPPTMTSTSNILMIVLTTGNYRNINPRFAAYYRITSTDEACSGNFFSLSGTILSPKYPENYPNGLTCVWTINVPTGKQVTLHVKDFLLEGRSPCKADYLEIRNGGYATSPLIGKYCGDAIDNEITSFGNQLHLKFVADASSTAKGFSLTWDGTVTGCGGEISGYSGSIVSPNYPLSYGRNAECTWRVAVSQGSLVLLSIVDIDLESHSNCLLDYVEIRDGIDRKAPLLGRYCSSSHPLGITSTGHTMFIRFRSDISRQGRGFHLKFSTVCNRTIKGFRGVIESPEFPSAFTLPVDCTWTLQAPTGNSFTVVFSHLMIISNKMYSDLCQSSPYSRYSFCRTNDCESSSMQIDEGTSTNGKMLGKFCNVQSPPTINSTFNEVKIHLKVSSSYAEILFRLEWFVFGCGGELKGKPYGELSSPEYPIAISRPTVCEWTIAVSLGSSIRINVVDLGLAQPNDCNRNYVQVFGGRDSSSPPLAKICHDTASPVVLQTSGNQAFVRLEIQDRPLKFRAVYEEIASNCGGQFSSVEGNIHSHNYPENYDAYDDCSYEITVTDNKRINLTFVDFDIDAGASCNTSYVKVYDGGVDSSSTVGNQSIVTLCGTKIPNPIISSSNKMFIRHNAGGRVSKGFSANYSEVCGAVINYENSETSTISHMGYYDKFSKPNCSWIVRSETLGGKFTLTFTKLEIRPTTVGQESAKLLLYGGEEDTSPLIATITGDIMPSAIEIPGSSFMINLVTVPNLHVSFELQYTRLDNACGGTLEADQGQFASPRYPNDYPPNVECIWVISNSPGNSLTLQIDDLHIETSDSCNENYLEIRSTDEGAKLVGAYCGQTLPPRITSNSGLWVKFKSSSGIDKGFRASYSVGFFNEIRGSSGEIESPRYPTLSLRKSDYSWRIIVGFKSLIEIRFREVNFYGSSESCTDKLIIYNGYDETGSILKESCGYGDSLSLPPLQSASNIVFIVFRAIAYPARFSLSWSQFTRAKNTSSSKTSSANCTQQLQIAQDASVSFSSPGFPYGYKSRDKCEWILVSDPQDHVEVSFTTMDLERTYRCNADNVKIYDGASDGSWSLLDTLCSQNDTLKEFSGSSMMKVEFSTDSFLNRTGFSATAKSVCGGVLTDPDGVIVLNRTGALTIPCAWNITVKPGKRIEFTFTTFKFPPNQNSQSCSSNNVILKDGFEEDAPFIGVGKYCDVNPPNTTMITSSNRLSVVASHPGYISSSQEMELHYTTKSRTCTSSVYLSNKKLKSMIIRSPNYPNMPPPHTECTWQFLAPNGETIHVEFLERFDLAYSVDCESEYLELRDGSTELSPLLGRHCYSTPPPFVMTEGNALFIKYFTDIPYPNNGFKARVSLADCGGSYHDFIKGKIESPNYPRSYDINMNCVWRLVNSDIDVFKLTFDNFNLGRLPTYLNNFCNTSVVDTLNITSVDRASPDQSESWMLCGRNASFPKEITGSEILLNFTSVTTPQYFSRQGLGFRLNIIAEKNQCGGNLNLPQGEIASPGYPSSISSGYCSWKITVAHGRRITFSLSDFDMDPAPANTLSHEVVVYNDFGFLSPIVSWNASVPPGTMISSSSNKMMIHFSNTYKVSSRRGFRGVYSSDLPSLCVASGLDKPTGSIRVDITQPFVCEWTILSKVDRSSTVITVVGTVDQGRHSSNQCFRSNSNLEFTLDVLGIVEFCSVAQPTAPFTFVTPFPSTDIKASSDKANISVNYTISWKTQNCGGVFDLEGEMVVESPVVGKKYPPNSDCIWKISYSGDTPIKLKFSSLDLDMTGSAVTDCSSDYISVYNGPGPSSPMILKTCGSILPQDITTLSNSICIHFHSDGSNEAAGFRLSVSPAAEACGGLLHDNTGTIQSVNYPNQYPNSSNCIYEIRVDQGYHIGLVFVGRFYLEESPGCTKDYVEVFDFNKVNEKWASLGKICGRNSPKIYNSTSNRMKVHFKSDDKVQGDGFEANWSINCGGIFDGSKPGVIHSPRYPREYEGDLYCNYTVAVNSKALLYGSFESFELEPRNPFGCVYDRVDIRLHYTNSRSSLNDSYSLLGTYCGNETPPRFVSSGSFKISFVTDRFTDFKGFLLNYGLEECGGIITEPTIIRTPVYKQQVGFLITNCTWRITAPVGKIVVIKIEELSLNAYRGCAFDRALIWDGPSKNVSSILATLCGELRERNGIYRATSNTAIIGFFTHVMTSSKKLVAEISFSDGCGGRVELTGSTETEIRSPEVNNKYKPSMDCVWTVSTQSSFTISATFKKFDLEKCVNPGNKTCHCDYLEIYDGIDENTELIGRFCGSTIPNGIMSSRSFLTIKFSSDDLIEKSGFILALKSIKSPCGIRLLNVTEARQTLTSPGFPENYPQNVHCSWVLSAKSQTFDIHVEEIDIIQSPACANDSLKIRDIGMGFPYTSGLTSNSESKVYIGNDKVSNLKPTMFMGSRFPFSTSIFCGKRKGVDYYSSSNFVMIKFVSSSSQTSKGFKLTYSLAGCSRNYTTSQGRINLVFYRKKCVMTIIAPNPNSTVSLYFSSVKTFSWSSGGEEKIKIYDGLDVTNSSNVLKLIKSEYRTPQPIFSYSSSVTIVVVPQPSSVSLDITYTTTTEGRGCGGYIFNYGGIFTSPLYPSNVRNFTTCKWTVAVPVGGALELEFTEFNLGPKHTCQSDYVEIYDVDPDNSEEVLRRTYCGGDTPAKYTGVKGQIAVRYVTSVHNGGTGWVARFMSRNTDPSWPALVGQHLIT